MMSDNISQLLSDYLDEIQKIDESDLSLRNKYIRLKRVLERNCKDITKGESLQFPSLFARLVFIAQRYNLPKQLEWQLQNIRVKGTFLLQDENHIVSATRYNRAKENIICFLSFIYNGDAYDAHNEVEEIENVDESTLPKDKLRVQVLSVDKASEIILCRANHLSDEDIKVRYNVQSVNDIFTPSIERLWIGAQLNLIDIQNDKDGNFIPKIFVLEPDYLIDSSAIAECFQNYGASHLHYFRRRFEPPANSQHILLGNLANFFLDELIYADDASLTTFDEVFLRSFRQMPFEYASCIDIQNNNDFRNFINKAKIHFRNIQRVILYDMPANGFDRTACTLEPSFFSEKYGFQGRLDLLQIPNKEDELYRIIELKSGKPPYPRENVTKVALNHEVQTTVYRLMIQSVFNKSARQIYPTILYSSSEREATNIRLAAPYSQLEKDIINTRNLIVATEHDIYTGGLSDVEVLFTELFDMNNYGRVPDFFINKLSKLKKILQSASELERNYIFRYISFITRELYIQKMGDEGYDSSMSTSALWNMTFNERRDALELISNLEIENIDDAGRGMIIKFSRSVSSDSVNFREGEICILYPRETEEDTILTNQILKGTIVKISNNHVIVRFRYKQRNRDFFNRYKHWVIEHDKLDHSYNSMFKCLISFLSAPEGKRQLLLGLREPVSFWENENNDVELPINLKTENVITKALAAENYFLIVGPPGTGKTSIFARKLIERLYANGDNILVIAYTNRAVDELCAAICEAFAETTACDKYIRIGSELSCHEDYRSRLLQNLAEKAQNRREILELISTARIVIGTLASIVGKPEIFDLKDFNVAIIDEASQILEPQIIGLLPLFNKFIMIGDQKQLSTITLQNEDKSKVEVPCLNEIELYDCRESLFERLFKLCCKNRWIHAFDTLTYHGRMHNDIASLVNDDFYDNMLKVATERQLIPLQTYSSIPDGQYINLVATQRLLFIPTREIGEISYSDKTNEKEANEVVLLVEAIYSLYKANNKLFDPQRTVGVITPYRNQIALIKHKLSETSISDFNNIMVDTVERYQGSQRDIIIVSFCFNQTYQIDFFSNMNHEGNVDRKLNVTLTRAREQLFLIGNDYIMCQHPIYRKLLNKIKILS